MNKRYFVFSFYLILIVALTSGLHVGLEWLGMRFESLHQKILFGGLAAALCIKTATELTKIHFEFRKPKLLPRR